MSKIKTTPKGTPVKTSERAGAYIRISTGVADDPEAMILTLDEPIQ